MSEQTPDASGGMADSHEPSMEDILASIRKIISDDDTAEAVDNSPPGFGDLAPDLVAETAKPKDTLDLDVLADSQDMEIPNIDNPATSGDEAMEPLSDIELLLNEQDVVQETGAGNTVSGSNDLDVLDLDVPFEDDPSAMGDDALTDVLSMLEDDIADVTAESEAPVATVEPDTSFDDDLSIMLDDMLADDEPETDQSSDERVVDPAADLLEETDLAVPDQTLEDIPSSGDADMDLVKSLMEDLTEEPLHDESSEAALEAPDIDAAADTEDADVMDEILSMTLDDETRLQEEAVSEDIAAQSETVVKESPSEDNPFLAIAAEAKADATAMETHNLSVMPKVAAGGAVMGAAVTTASATSQPRDTSQPKDDVDAAIEQLDALITERESYETELDIPDPDPEPEPIHEETPDMPRAASKETIIDEVTETATADVFSSLNKVVEEKAVLAERGDRIGDLVMDALRPMLKEWLDANLKGIVERAVTKEVKRISSGK